VPERPPFPFVVGCGRSGTTLVQALLNAHPDFAVPFESYFPVWFARHLDRYERPEGFALATFLDDVLAHESFRRWNLDPQWARATIEADAPANYPDAIRACFAAYARAQGKPRYADKTPIFISQIPLLSELFPEAVFVHLVRDGRDVALSRRKAAWGTHRLDLELLVWSAQIERGSRAGRALSPKRYREIRYEALVDDVERVARELCEFVRADFDPVMLRYPERAEQILVSQPFPEDHQNLLRPPTKGLSDWRRELSAPQVALCDALAGKTLRRFGYETSTAPVPAALHARAAFAKMRYMSLTQYRRGRSALWRALHRSEGPRPGGYT
jgi:hypothetical protein